MTPKETNDVLIEIHELESKIEKAEEENKALKEFILSMASQIQIIVAKL